MGSKNIVLSGTFYWARPHEGQEDEYEDKKFYKVTLVPDDASWAKFARTGLKLKKKPVNKDDGAPEGLTFKRDLEPKEVQDQKTGKIKFLGGGPIPVVDADGNTIKDEIGNGSKGDLLIAVYNGKYKNRQYTGHRTEKMRVTKLIKYDPWAEGDFDENDVQPDDEEEEKVEDKKETKKSKFSQTLDDDLPF